VKLFLEQNKVRTHQLQTLNFGYRFDLSRTRLSIYQSQFANQLARPQLRNRYKLTLIIPNPDFRSPSRNYKHGVARVILIANDLADLKLNRSSNTNNFVQFVSV
jgi:hypothetical protein